MNRTLPRVLVAVGLAVLLSACSSSSQATSRRTGGTIGAVPPRPAGKNPSESAKMVCAPAAQTELASSLGATPVQVTTPTWVNHTYACQYTYPNGTFSLTVKELDSAKQTTDYFNALATQFGRRPGRLAVGQGAFVTSDGSVVVRKDWKVLYVDVSHLPPQFGQPPQPAADAALSVAATILSCWSGA